MPISRSHSAIFCASGGGSGGLYAAAAEPHYTLALATQATPESLYERQWACVLIDQTLQQLEIEMRAAGKEALFEHFSVMLGAAARDIDFQKLASAVDLSVNALHGAMHRWRQRYHALLRSEIARTVVSKAEIEDELCHLQRVFSRP